MFCGGSDRGCGLSHAKEPGGEVLQFCFVRFENFITKRRRLAYTVLVLMGTDRFTNWKALPVVLYLFKYQVHLRVCLPVCLLFVCLFVCLTEFVCLFVCSFVCLFVRLFNCLNGRGGECNGDALRWRG